MRRLLTDDEVHEMSIELQLAHDTAVSRDHAVDMLLIEYCRSLNSEAACKIVNSVYDYLDDKDAGQ